MESWGEAEVRVEEEVAEEGGGGYDLQFLGIGIGTVAAVVALFALIIFVAVRRMRKRSEMESAVVARPRCEYLEPLAPSRTSEDDVLGCILPSDSDVNTCALHFIHSTVSATGQVVPEQEPPPKRHRHKKKPKVHHASEDYVSKEVAGPTVSNTTVPNISAPTTSVRAAPIPSASIPSASTAKSLRACSPLENTVRVVDEMVSTGELDSVRTTEYRFTQDGAHGDLSGTSWSGLSHPSSFPSSTFSSSHSSRTVSNTLTDGGTLTPTL